MGGKSSWNPVSWVDSGIDATKKAVKNYTSKEFLTSPGRWFMAGSTMGLS